MNSAQSISRVFCVCVCVLHVISYLPVSIVKWFFCGPLPNEMSKREKELRKKKREVKGG
jgi:hypothetical protein